jgi:hypothetical protein
MPSNRACSELKGVIPAGKPYIALSTSNLSANLVDAFLAVSMISFRQDQKFCAQNLKSVALVTGEFRSRTPIFLNSESRSIGDRRITAAPKSRDAAITLVATNKWSMNGVVNPFGMPGQYVSKLEIRSCLFTLPTSVSKAKQPLKK